MPTPKTIKWNNRKRHAIIYYINSLIHIFFFFFSNIFRQYISMLMCCASHCPNLEFYLQCYNGAGRVGVLFFWLHENTSFSYVILEPIRYAPLDSLWSVCIHLQTALWFYLLAQRTNGFDHLLLHMTIKNYASDMLFCFILSCKIILLANQSSQNGRISSMDFHRLSNYLVTASDDESIRLYDVANATYDSSLIFISFFSSSCVSLYYISKSNMRWNYSFLHLMDQLSVGSEILCHYRPKEHVPLYENGF